MRQLSDTWFQQLIGLSVDIFPKFCLTENEPLYLVHVHSNNVALYVLLEEHNRKKQERAQMGI